MQAVKCILAVTVAAVFFHAPNVLGQQPASDHPVETESQETNIHIPSEVLLEFRLDQPAILPAAR
jgi:hypothetical protein